MATQRNYNTPIKPKVGCQFQSYYSNRIYAWNAGEEANFGLPLLAALEGERYVVRKNGIAFGFPVESVEVLSDEQ